MIIRGTEYPSIGLIRARPIAGTDRYELKIYPPQFTVGGLPGHEPAMLVEVEVDRDEVERIACVAPHLLAQPTPRHPWENQRRL